VSYEVEHPGRRSGTASEVMCSVDEVDGQRRLVIADIARDDTWISTVTATACDLEEWQ